MCSPREYHILIDLCDSALPMTLPGKLMKILQDPTGWPFCVPPRFLQEEAFTPSIRLAEHFTYPSIISLHYDKLLFILGICLLD